MKPKALLITGSLAFKVFDPLVASGKEAQAKGWLEWQIADDSRVEAELLQGHISKSACWSDTERSKKEKYIKDFMAPLILDEDVFNEILSNC